eukprot:m.38681 g.38681  ORF g.38681 m.38681 type:complete len:1088 (-) comp10232_c0_seq2:2424-5687(-)
MLTRVPAVVLAIYLWSLPTHAQIDEIGCPSLEIVGHRGSHDFVNGIYDKLSTKHNGRPVYLQRRTVPTTYDDVALHHSKIYLFWFVSGQEADWTIGPIVGTDDILFAYNPADEPVPELLPKTWFVSTDQGLLSPSSQMECDCWSFPYSAANVDVDLLHASYLSASVGVILGGTISFVCDESITYDVVRVTEQGWQTCNASSIDTFFSFMGTCVANSTLVIDTSTPSLVLGTVELPWQAEDVYFLTVTTGTGSVYRTPTATSPTGPGIGGYCDTSYAKQVVTIVPDTVPPTITCPADITKDAAPSNSGVDVTWELPNVSDNLDSPEELMLTIFPSTLERGQYFVIGTTMITYNVKDTSGNRNSCTFTVTVVDTEPPTFTSCPATTVVTSQPGVFYSVVTWTEPTAEDNDRVVSVTTSHRPGSTFPFGLSTVSYRATDASGLQTYCNFTVIVTPLASVTLVSHSNTSLLHGQSAVVVAQVMGVPPYSLSWWRNGIFDPSLTGSRVTLSASEIESVEGGLIVLEVDIEDGSGRTARSTPLRLELLPPSRYDVPPSGSAYITFQIELTSDAISADVFDSRTSQQSLLLCQVLYQHVEEGLCQVLGATDEPSAGALQRVLSNVRLQVNDGHVQAVIQKATTAILGTTFPHQLRAYRISEFTNLQSSIELDSTTGLPTARAAFVSLHKNLCNMTCSIPSSLDAQCTAEFDAGTCHGGDCFYDVNAADLSSCDLAEYSTTGTCMAGVCRLSQPSVDCIMSSWSSWMAVTPDDAAYKSGQPQVKRTRSIVVAQQRGGRCFATEQVLLCTSATVASDSSATDVCAAIATLSSTEVPASTTKDPSGSTFFSFDNPKFIMVVVAAGCIILLIIVITVVCVTVKRVKRNRYAASDLPLESSFVNDGFGQDPARQRRGPQRTPSMASYQEPSPPGASIVMGELDNSYPEPTTLPFPRRKETRRDNTATPISVYSGFGLGHASTGKAYVGDVTERHASDNDSSDSGEGDYADMQGKYEGRKHTRRRAPRGAEVESAPARRYLDLTAGPARATSTVVDDEPHLPNTINPYDQYGHDDAVSLASASSGSQWEPQVMDTQTTKF